MNDMNKNWFALYTKPRWEKKVDSILIRKGIESWCPVQKVERTWSDRRKVIEDPIFKSYVFVHINEDERLPVLQTDGVLNFVHFMGKPAVIKDEEVANVKMYLLEKDVRISVESLSNFEENDKVIIRQGIFMDNTGTVLKAGSRKIYVRIESLEQVMIVEFPTSYVEKFELR
jgi:transcription antitermination factor NusG